MGACVITAKLLMKDNKYLQCLQLHLFASIAAAEKPNHPLGGEDRDAEQLIFNVIINLHVCVFVQWEVNGSHLTQSQTLPHLSIE